MNRSEYEDICRYLKDVTADSRWEGHIYAVGGCCRDALLGVDIKDIDLAIDLPGGGIDFADWMYDKGLTEGEPERLPMFGTARIELKAFPGVEIEVVQTRREKYTDRNSRHPETAYGSIGEDASRRDLTVNALYRDLKTGEYLDPNGTGMADLESRILRTPANPDVTFDDDPVRILRCIRFAARLGWRIEEDTLAALSRNVERLTIVSTSRMRSELEKMLTGERVAEALEMLRTSGALPYVLPELIPTVGLTQNDAHGGTVWEQTLRTLSHLPADLPLRLAGLFHDIGKVSTRLERGDKITYPSHEQVGAQIAHEIMRRLRIPRDIRKEVEFLVRRHTAVKRSGDDGSNISDVRLRRLQLQCGNRDRWNRLLQLIEADNLSYAAGYRREHQIDGIRRRTAELESRKESMLNYRLPLSVRDICRTLHIKRSHKVAEYIDFLKRAVCENPHLTAGEMKQLLRARVRK